MKITTRFVGDHKTFRKLNGEISQIAEQPANQRDQKRLVRLVELLKDHMVLHDWGEETFFYPAVRERLSATSAGLTTTYMDLMSVDHRAVDVFLDDLENQAKEKPLGGQWTDTFASFLRSLTEHMEKEESVLFPFAEGLLGADALEQISNDVEKRRSEAPAIRRHSPF